jgi:hypothetical protein
VSTFLRGFLTAAPEADGLLTPRGEVFERFEPGAGPNFDGPVIVVVDETMLSAPEFVAAALVDNGRAIAFASRPTGAGGNQRWVARDRVCPPGVRRDERLLSECLPAAAAAAMKELGVTGFGYSAAIGVRVRGDGNVGPYIEDEGLTPQVEYRIGERDLREGFAPMRDNILATLRSLAARNRPR